GGWSGNRSPPGRADPPDPSRPAERLDVAGFSAHGGWFLFTAGDVLAGERKLRGSGHGSQLWFRRIGRQSLPARAGDAQAVGGCVAGLPGGGFSADRPALV